MSRTEQVTRVARVVGAVRLTAALRAIGLPRATWYRHQRRRVHADKYGHLREALEQIARTHPEYGYRRVAVELQRTWGQPVNAKVVRRLHRLWDLPLLRTARRPRPSGIQRVITTAGPLANLVARTAVIPVFAVTYTDFSQLVFVGGQRIAYLLVLVDHASKVVPGSGRPSRSIGWASLIAWGRACPPRMGWSPSWRWSSSAWAKSIAGPRATRSTGGSPRRCWRSSPGCAGCESYRALPQRRVALKQGLTQGKEVLVA